MKLLLSLTSPFARKVRVVLIEKQVHSRVEQVVVDPWADDPALLAANPLLQVPALVLDDGLALTNSDTIVGWLDRRYPEPPLWPADAAQRTRAEAIAALTQGLLEFTVFLVLEKRKPAELQSRTMMDRRLAGIERAVQALADRFDRRTDAFHQDAIGVACALAYLDFRQPQLRWREHHPVLAQWLDWAAQRPSMQSTQPPSA